MTDISYQLKLDNFYYMPSYKITDTCYYPDYKTNTKERGQKQRKKQSVNSTFRGETVSIQ